MKVGIRRTTTVVHVLIITLIISWLLVPSYNNIWKVYAITGVPDPTGGMKFPIGSSFFESSHANKGNNNGFTTSATDSVISTIPVGAGPYGAVYDPDNNRIYVANYDEGSVSVIDAKTNKVVANISNVGVNPRELLIIPIMD